MTIKHLRFIICIASVGFCARPASALVLYSDNFNVDSSGSWTVNKAPTASAAAQIAEFAYDYSGFGIPAAPGSADTLGLRLRANVPADTSRPAGTTSGLSVSPTGQNFGTSYQMQFYAWSNFAGTAANTDGLEDNGTSEGGTNNIMFAIGTSGTVPLVVANTSLVTNGQMDGIGFATTGDGGITNDYRVYPKSGTIAPATSGDYAAGTANDANGQVPFSNTNVFYQAMPSLATHTAPAIQQTLSTAEYGSDANNTQQGHTQIGSFGFAWHKVVITKSNNIVTWKVDDTLLATVNTSSLGALGGNNIALGESDVNSSTARHPSLVFTVFDNLVVSTLSVSGDFNNNGTVDAADYVLWRDHLGDATEAAINSNGDGLNGVDQADFTLWRSRFGSTSGSGSGASLGAAVPEPSSLLLVIFSAGGLCCRPKRQRS